MKLYTDKDQDPIYGIIKRKKDGIEQTESESAEIKGWLRELKLPFEQPTIAEVQLLFPQEYGEFLDEVQISRPQTRGELLEKLKRGVKCEVVASNEEITSICLDGWLGFKGQYKTYPSENDGWVIYEAIK